MVDRDNYDGRRFWEKYDKKVWEMVGELYVEKKKWSGGFGSVGD